MRFILFDGVHTNLVVSPKAVKNGYETEVNVFISAQLEKAMNSIKKCVTIQRQIV
jgi:hypothetical protein